MKKFILTVFSISVFCFGVSGLIRQVGAKFKSDEHALAILRQARIAIGGEEALRNVRSLSISGKQSFTLDFNGTPRTMQGDVEINMQLPNQFVKMMKLESGDNIAGSSAQMLERKEVNVVTLKKGDGDNIEWKAENGNPPDLKANGTTKIIIKKDHAENGATPLNNDRQIIVNKDVRTNGGAMRQNELLHTTLGLLLSAPEGLEVNYTFAGEGNVDGTVCNIIEATSGGESVKLFIAQISNLPLMMSYQGVKMPKIIRLNKTPAAVAGTPEKDVKVFVRQTEAPETVEFQVKFADYRTVNGVLLPYRWTQTAGGKDEETTEISSYEINPANIAEKFNKLPNKVMMRTKKPE